MFAAPGIDKVLICLCFLAVLAVAALFKSFPRSRLPLRSVTTSEPRWTEEDRAEALALTLYRSRPCPCGCGNPAAMTLIPEDQGPDWAVQETTCTARLALLEAQRGAAERRGDGYSKNAPASLWIVQPRKR